MVLRLIADRADEIPEALRGAAVEKDGRWFADLGNHSVEDVGGLKERLVNEREARKKLEGMLKSFGWSLHENGSKWTMEGLDPAQARDALEKIRAGQLKGSDEYERFKDSLVSKFDEDRKRIEGSQTKLRERLRQAMVTEPIRAAIREAGGSVELLAPVVERSTKVDFDDEGNVTVSLLNDKGNPMLTKKSGSTEPMGFDEFVQDLRKHPSYRAAFAGMGAGGTGFNSQGGGTARAVRAGSDVSLSSPRELIERGNQYSPQRA